MNGGLPFLITMAIFVSTGVAAIALIAGTVASITGLSFDRSMLLVTAAAVAVVYMFHAYSSTRIRERLSRLERASRE